MKNNTDNKLNVEEYSVSEVCYFTGAKRQEIYQDIDKGILKAYRKGNKYYFLKKDIDEYKKYLDKKSNEVLKKSSAIMIIPILILLIILLFVMF